MTPILPRSCLFAGLACLIGCSAAPVADQTTLQGPGAYAFATKSFTFTDTSRPTPPNGTYPGAPSRKLVTQVWYPADATSKAPAAGGPFPIIAYAHGFTANAGSGGPFGEHLASHGYVVAAPDFPLSSGGAPGGPTLLDLPSQPGDLAFVLDSVAGLGGADAALGAAVDRTRRGVLGLSLGGGTVLIAAYHPKLQLSGIQAAVAQAPLSCFFGPAFFSRSLPTLVMSGDADEIVPTQQGPAQAFQRAPAPVAMLTLHGGNHLGFVGIDLPALPNADDFGCSLLSGVATSGGFDALTGALSAGAPPGTIDPSGCSLTLCAQKVKQTMTSSRQLDLAKAATLAHFEARLRGRDDAARFLTQALGPQNPDVAFQDKE